MAPVSDWKTPMCLRWTTEKKIPGKGCQSPAFSFQSTQYYLSLYVVSNYYSLFVETQSGSSNSNRICNCSVQVESRSGKVLPPLSRINRNVDVSKKCIWGFGESDILEVDPDILSEGVFRFLVILDAVVEPQRKNKEVQSVQTPPYMDASPCLEKLSQEFSKLLDKDPSTSDVQFQCKEDKTVKAHKNVLCIRSPVFNSMLQSDMTEGRTGLVKIPDVDAEEWREFLRYIYTGALPELTVQKAMDLYETGDRYAVDALTRRCGDFLLQNLSHENACEVLALFDAHNDSIFTDGVIVYILQEKIPLKDEHWPEFSENYPKLANKVLNRFCKLHCSEKE